MMDQQRSSWTVKKSYSHKAKKRSVKIVSFNHDKKIQIKKQRYKGRKREKQRKNKKRTRKSFTKGREDGKDVYKRQGMDKDDARLCFSRHATSKIYNDQDQMCIRDSIKVTVIREIRASEIAK